MLRKAGVGLYRESQTIYPWNIGNIPFDYELAALPITTSQTTVHSESAFNAAAQIDGTEITIGTGWSGNSLVTIGANDLDIIIPPNVSVGAIQIAAYAPTVPYSRIRIRGPSPGRHSGGRMGQLRDFGVDSGTATHTDVTLDGIDLNGDSSFGGGETNQAFRTSVNRLVVVNCRAIAQGYIWLGAAANVVIANSNFYHGAATRAQMSYAEGWGIRNTRGPFIIVDSRIQGTRYVNVRVQATDTGPPNSENLYIGRSSLVAVAEGRNLWCWNSLAQGYRGESAYIENCDIYSYCDPTTGEFAEEINITDVEYSRISNNRFYGGGLAVFTQAELNSTAAAAEGDHDSSIGNTFFSLPASQPAWGGPGDPTLIPLPDGYEVSTGEAPNPGYVW